MSKFIMFSRTFPAYHPKAGQPTFFIEKIWSGFSDMNMLIKFDDGTKRLQCDFHQYYNSTPKYHTIRSGSRFTVGEKFSPRVWEGKPYKSKQIIIGPDIEIKKIWEIDIEQPIKKLTVFNDNEHWYQFNKGSEIQKIAKNDGLSLEDFWSWFPGNFNGQIICWNDKIEY